MDYYHGGGGRTHCGGIDYSSSCIDYQCSVMMGSYQDRASMGQSEIVIVTVYGYVMYTIDDLVNADP